MGQPQGKPPASGEPPAKEFYLCTRCKAESDTGKDHLTDLDCATRWREIASMVTAPIFVAQQKIKLCRAMRHGRNLKLVVKGEALDWCSACVSAALAAHTMQGRYVGFFSGRQEKRASNGETSDR